MKLITLEPGDGTRYRVGYDYETIENEERSDRITFAFGVGFEPMTMYQFDPEADCGFDYFAEKMGKMVGGHNEWTLWVGYFSLLTLQGSWQSDFPIPENIRLRLKKLNYDWGSVLGQHNFIAWRMGYGIWADEKTKRRLEMGYGEKINA